MCFSGRLYDSSSLRSIDHCKVICPASPAVILGSCWEINEITIYNYEGLQGLQATSQIHESQGEP